ncbi:ATP-binding protein [Candidatus Nitrososphaera sp. FF02]|uniref:ATP-binding protein n=1 Tax=Candidatus Nitrososphaera sp. FF02 TaxID=3398226 RepID=UPI0039EB5E2F
MPLAIIGLLAAILSVASYQYSQAAVAAVSEIASEDIRNNAEIQAKDFAIMFATRLESVDSNLQILSTAPALRNHDEPKVLLDVAQTSTDYLTKFYVLLDEDGNAISASGNGIEYLHYLNASEGDYFTVPQQTRVPYTSNLINIQESSASDPILYISHPIIDPLQTDPDGRRLFKGVVTAAIGLDISGLILERSVSHTRINSVEILDNDGTVLYSRTESLVGTNILSGDLPWQVVEAERASLQDFISAAVEGSPMTDEFTVDGKVTTMVAEPVIVNGQHLWTIYVTAPHTLSSDIRDLFNDQNFFSSLSLAVIASVTVGIGLIIVSWNKRLAKTVDERTFELRKANESLATSNSQLMSLNEKLAANEKLQQEFINIASHEMKTPAQAILLHSGLLKKQPHDNAESVNAILRNAERLQRLTNNILDVTRIESQNLKLNIEQLNMKDVVTEIAKEYGDILRSRNNDAEKIKITCNADDAIVMADKSRITQVLSNLLSNAIEFTREGEIDVTCEWKDNQAYVKVRDNGSGIDEEILPRLFTKFATKSDKGTGLGLFVSKSIIEAHGGKIWAENNKEIGATFAFALPAVTVD